MMLKNKRDGLIYHVQTEEDDCGGFCIFATDPIGDDPRGFVMHYRTLAEFNDGWEDV